jgi:hypothetical protein
MIDIHPPQHAAITRRDFFIHLFIVVLGILIAIGLEQSVEYIHHRHQRNELEANMRTEAQRNIQILSVHLDVNIPNLLWDRAALAAIRSAAPKAGFIDVALPPPEPHPTDEVMIAPVHAVWPAAQAAGTVILLPDQVARGYSVLDHQWESDDREVERIRDATALMTRFELATGDKILPRATLHLSIAQRDQLLTALATQTQSLFDLLHRDNLFLLACQAVVQGDEDPDSFSGFMLHHDMRINHYR